METISFNIAAPERRTLQGREYLVAEATLIKGDTVLPGSRGPGFYPASEVASERNSQAWNRMPLVLWHPQDEQGDPTTARDPAVLENYGVGDIYRTKGDGKDSRTEAWFDVQLLKNADARFAGKRAGFPLLPRIERGDKIELSTGLFPTYDMTPGIAANGVRYDWVARDLRPDHVAILPDQKGACNVSDGCGVNNSAADYGLPYWKKFLGMLGVKFKTLKDVTNESTLSRPGAEVEDETAVANDWTDEDAVAAIQNARMCWGKPCDGGGEGGSGTASPSDVEKTAAESALSKHKGERTQFALKQSAAAEDSGQHVMASMAHRSAKVAVGRHHPELSKAHEVMAKYHDSKTEQSAKKQLENNKIWVSNGTTGYDVNQEKPMKLTTNQRAEIVRDLCTNCTCHKGKEKVLNALDDAQLQNVADAAKLVLVVNALKTGKKPVVNAEGEGEAVPGVAWPKLAQLLGIDIDPRVDPVGFTSAMSKALSSINDKLGGAPTVADVPEDEPVMSAETPPDEQEDPEEAAMAANRSKKFDERSLSAEVREDLAYVRNQRREEKTELIKELLQPVPVANRKAVGDKFWAMDLPTLRLMRPVQQQRQTVNHNSAPDWSMATAPPTVNVEEQQINDETVALMTANEFGEEAAA